ncbi:MAG: hypothetical protein RLZZ618_3306 [Pseudomonadota bacterium]|jgi:hypothetical protein
MTKSSKKPGFQCATCGKWHDELLTDLACRLPDEVFALEYLEAYQRVRHNADFCTLDGKRFFLRCVLPVPFTYTDGFFGWGVWVEVSKKHHDLVLKTFSAGAGEVPPFEGRLANKLKRYRSTLGLEVTVQLSGEHRPFVNLLRASRHALALEQRKGIDFTRHHEIAAPFL